MNFFKKITQFFTSDKGILITVIIASAFFALYKLTSIPPGTQNDVIRSVLTAEQFLNKLDGDGTSLRQILAYFFNGGYWTYSFIDIFRSNLNITAINIISRLPAVIFCVFTAITWLNILKTLKINTRSIFLFFLIFLPSSLFLTYSHHIPLVAGYFFFTSASMYFLLKFINSNKSDLHYLIISLVTAAIATYTHGISIFFVALFYLIFGILVITFQKESARTKIQILSETKAKSAFKLVLAVIITGAFLIPLFMGIFGSDRSLQIRDATTIKYLVENNEYGLVAGKAFEKIKAYLHPNTLVFSGDIVEGEQPINSPEFFDIKNARFNQWVTTHLSPFGAISAIIYLAVPLTLIMLIMKVIPEKKRLPYIFLLALAGTYILLPIFPNYDNPSVAKSIPALMFIPLGITLLSSYISQGKKFRYLWYLLFIPVLINAGYNLYYMYSDDYQVNERAKYYQYNTVNLAEDIAETPSLHNTRIFLTVDNIDLQNAMSFYLSPYILDRVVYGRLDTSLIHPDEYTYVVTQQEEDLVALQELGTTPEIIRYTYPDGSLDFMLAKIEPENSLTVPAPIIVGEGSVRCIQDLFHPFYTGEMEYLIHQYRYYSDTDSVYIERCIDDFPKEYGLLDIGSLDLRGTILSTNLSPDVWGQRTRSDTAWNLELDDETRIAVDDGEVEFTFAETEDVTEIVDVDMSDRVTYTNHALNMTANEWPAKASVELLSEDVGTGTFLFEFDYSKDDFSFIDLYIIEEETSTNIPISLLAQDYDPVGEQSYQTIFFVPTDKKIIIGIDLHNRHLNLDKTDHTVSATLSDMKITRLTNHNLIGMSGSPEEISTDRAEYRSVPTVKSVVPGILKISRIPNIDETQTVVLNQPFSNTNITFGTKASSSFTLTNGIAQGIQIESNHASGNDVWVVNIGWIIGVIYLGLFVTIPGFLVLYRRDRS